MLINPEIEITGQLIKSATDLGQLQLSPSRTSLTFIQVRHGLHLTGEFQYFDCQLDFKWLSQPSKPASQPAKPASKASQPAGALAGKLLLSTQNRSDYLMLVRSNY